MVIIFEEEKQRKKFFQLLKQHPDLYMSEKKNDYLAYNNVAQFY